MAAIGSLRMTRQRETRNFIIFEHQPTRQVIYLEKSAVEGTPIATADVVNVTIQVAKD